MHGYGSWMRPDGETYAGEWMLDKRHGKGVALTPDGR